MVPDLSRMGFAHELLNGREDPPQQHRFRALRIDFAPTTIRRAQEAEPRQRPARPEYDAVGLLLLYGTC